MKFKVHAFGEEVEKFNYKNTPIPESLAECVKRDIESLLLQVSGMTALQRKSENGNLININTLKSIEDCRQAAYRVHSDKLSVDTSICSNHLMVRREGGNSLVAAWIKQKIQDQEVVTVSIKSGDTVAIGKDNGDRKLMQLSSLLSINELRGVSMLYDALKNTRETSNVLRISIESASRAALQQIAKAAHLIAINNYHEFDAVEFFKKKYEKYGSLDVNDIKTYPPAGRFTDLFRNYKNYVTPDSAVTISNDGKVVSLIVTGDRIYQGTNLGRCNINESEAETIKRKLEAQYHSVWLSANPTENLNDLAELGLSFDELNQTYFTNTYRVVATEGNVAVVPCAPAGISASRLSEMVAVEVLAAIKHAKPTLYETLNRYALVLDRTRESGADPRIVLMVANNLDPKLGTVFANYPLTSADKEHLNSFLEQEFSLGSREHHAEIDDQSVVSEMSRGEASMSN